MTRIRGYKYRAYPDKKQREFFERTFGCCRFVYNYYLEAKQQIWNEWHDTLSYSEMSKDLSHVLKKENAWLKEADSIALQQSLRHLDRAYDNFFKRRGGYPKFKRKRSAQSYRTMSGNGNISIEGNMINLPKAGYVKIVNTRIFEGRIISATVSRTASDRYYISLQVEEEFEVLPNKGGEIGIDAGLKSLYTDSDANSVISPNIRNDFQHKISYRLANENQVVCIEDLDVKGMMADHRLAKAITDASWSGFYRKLEYKMADHGGVLIRVPKTYPSSQRCSCCGKIIHKVRDLSVRRWTCPVCGAEHDRDINAAKNILEKGLEMLAS